MLSPATSKFWGARALTLLAVAAAVAVVCVAPAVTASLLAEDEAAAAQFSSFKQQYHKTYATPEEEAHRLRVFRENMADAKRMDAANPHALFGVTLFSDLTPEEFRMRYANGAEYFAAAMANPLDVLPELNITVAGAIDWRQRGAVTGVKNQGNCGSCWAFATIGNVEGVWKVSGKPLTVLSEQQLVSCDRSNGACQGGLMDVAMAWIIRRQGGLVYTAASWPYVSGNGRIPACSTAGRRVGARIRNAFRVSPSDRQIATQLNSRGPLSAALDATSLQYYRSGVITRCYASRITHAVLIVGYTQSGSMPYWIIKNSWSTAWGEQGYFRILMGRNLCLINSYVVTATV